MKYLIVLFFISIGLSAQEIKTKNLKKHVEYLSSDKLQGRGTGTAGEKMASDYIIKQFKKAGLSPMGENGGFLQHFPAKKGKPGQMVSVDANNVVGFVDNKKPYSIVIGAHYDHLGMGDQGSSLQANSEGQVHNGADDNASGVAGVLELARYFSKNKITENYNLIFIAFSGEELGLVGSKFIADNPTFDLKNINCMFNLDMIGRYRTDKGVNIGGVGSSKFWEENATKLADNMSIKYTVDSSGIGPSDHTSFYLKDIPVLFLFTGAHQEYHKPSDDANLINYEGQKLMTEYIAKMVDLLGATDKITFKKTSNPHSKAAKSTFKVTMGVIPDYSFDGKGMKIDGTTDGKPAEKAGMKAGDIVQKIGDIEIKDVYSYMEALGKHEKGQTVTIKILRKGEILELPLTF
ncbi:MAG: M20/M25/M40 family metallo-hydrolase [Cytophagaceae bacterium]|nr:M20/M25/M40 family metallo-hydrolase [Cytophagaceae bacterium]MBK9511563.1 M20/M25/M40 family metallo-hydrolase [Cytophagaceae bacterium]MBK9932948.1 M20/M25/M40 family metallo-hydrolase [Cytophagaceae bacterium]MBL0303340.1 M20/M25/M40 family metallo-hydrolase [Cytophagaceae bacterium]MBL0326190.1 M20/M25/M40 family metallo-hydrolase [Cytophagaceae bacterium]